MTLTSEFRDPDLASSLVKKIQSEADTVKNFTIMEVCGTHTASICKFGIKSLLPANVKLISGPGCPVCVTSQGEIDVIFNIAKRYNVAILTFGDMMKVPGSSGENLLDLKAQGCDVRVILSPLDAVGIAEKESEKYFVLVGIGFETTAPAIASAVKSAKEKNINNFYLLPYNKTMPEVLRLLLSDENIKIDGFLCPGHVSVITGENLYEPIVDKKKAAVIAGFEPIDILSSILYIIKQIKSENYFIHNNYSRAVNNNGNAKARDIMNTVFKPCTAEWRGLGDIGNSGLCLRDDYASFDALSKFDIHVERLNDIEGCRCGDILKGYLSPYGCSMFATTCTPDSPMGPCMVSVEGACSSYYKYNKD